MAPLSHYAVIGSPVSHSLSPALFQALFKHLGVPADYVARKVNAAELPAALDDMRQGAFDGFSVTQPHKEVVMEWLDEVEPAAAKIGAVNCLKREGQKVKGFNTDAFGFQRALEHSGCRLRGAQVLLLGAGGAGRACAFAAVEGGVGRLILANRTPQRAGQLLEALSSRIEWDMDVQVMDWDNSLKGVMRDVDVVVNATSVGMGTLGEDALPRGCELSARHRVFDLVYQPLRTPLLERASRAGAKTFDGLWMLVFQAMEQFRIFTGKSVPETLAPSLHAFLVNQAGR